MAEHIISVKMPSSLVAALEKRREQDHYLDLSEQLRSVVRQRCLEITNPYTEGIRRIKEDLKHQTATQSAREQIVQDLLRLLEEKR